MSTRGRGPPIYSRWHAFVACARHSCASQYKRLPKRHLLLSLQTLELTELLPNLPSQALDYLHCRQRVVHGDLKPENALMGASGRIALSDFGCRQGLLNDGF